MEYKNCKKATAVPEASSMIETFRAIGYSIEAAVADIIDNSISAFAKNVWINFKWEESKTSFSVMDDGTGMDSEEIIQAMRLGSKNPLDYRDSSDLGRFGLGLKTASFSQCRKLSVISKKDKCDIAYWTWDLDFVSQVKEWKLLEYVPDDDIKLELNKINSGTVVLWNAIDRLVKNINIGDKKALAKFAAVMEQIKDHISMVFHRFIESGKINIYFQGRKLGGWDPFIHTELSVQSFPEENLYEGKVLLKGYVLPHKSKLSEEMYKSAEGPKGWNEQQGFYIYRNNRLILAGNWLGLFRKEEHYKLARIKIDLPNDLDTEWQIDIKKSIARPPLFLKENLKAYALKVRYLAVEVYRHRGKSVKKLPGQKFTPLWIEHKRGDKWFFKINRDHLIIEKAKNDAIKNPDKAINDLLRFIEETIPSKSIYIKEAESPETQGAPFEKINHDPIKISMKQIFDKFIQEGKTPEEAKSRIINIEPFNQFSQFLEFME